MVVSSRTGQNLGKPWLTVLFDATCRAVLAIYLSFDGPSRDSLMMILRDCVERHGRLPFGMVVDNGAEFLSTYFQTLTGGNGTHVTYRPPHEARFGNPVENFFHVKDIQFIHMLEGSSDILKTPRLATKSVNPENRAVWTLKELFEALEHYCFVLFNERVHADLGKTPNAAMAALMKRHGIDRLPGKTLDFDFLVQTMPEIDGGTGMVQKPCGIKVRTDYFHNPLLAGFLGRNLPVRWDPMDPAHVLVQLPTGWVSCFSRFAKDVEGLSVRDVKFFAQETRQRHPVTAGSHIQSDTKLGEFMLEAKTSKEPAMRRRKEQALENHALNSTPSGQANGSSTLYKPPSGSAPSAPPSAAVPKMKIEIPTAILAVRKKANNLL